MKPQPPAGLATVATGGAAAPRFLSIVNAWMELTGVLNELSCSMGQPDFYPFALSARAVSKLHFVHMVVAQKERAAAG
ncbi:putative zinc-binding metallopeptidase [Schlegelella sp. S2-27]|uniref:Zinc-binding metallopeptidase n=1 Tax=Caldimonas mangrovi TaxID=2944811 RepID=A0ABT0YRC0_9BURK|nr:putative zinc-binding metallopeptidase [Caldimonas mangrovi]MCM5681290.1 putative zinc-binding metallopeptidase [Caldimonas mangrovi]